MSIFESSLSSASLASLVRRRPTSAAGAVALAAVLALGTSTFARAQQPSATVPAAQPAPASNASSQVGATDGRYQLAPGDRLSILVFDQPEISSTYLVEPTNSISLPLIGEFSVAGLTPQALQEQLTARLSDGFLKNPVVSVRLTDLRPVTIVGAVRSPGSYTYIDGMNVETALALAGGSLQVDSEFALQRADFLQADERLKTLRLQHLSQIARSARLEAQLSGKKIKPPSVDPADAAILKKLIEGEQQMMDFEAESQQRQIDLLAERAKQIEADIRTFGEQAELEKEQLKFLEGQIDDYKSLLVNGLTKKSSVLDAEREKSRGRASLSNILGNIARSQSQLAEAELQRQQLSSTFQNQKMAELQSVKLQIAESESSLPLAREARALKLDRLPYGTSEASSGPPRIKILRYASGKIVSMDGKGNFEIWPGDIVQIGNGLGQIGTPPAAGRPPRAGPAPFEDHTAPSGTPERVSQR